MKDIRLVIKKERISQGMSQSELADKIGVSTRAVAHWENRTRGITVENADRALKVLRTTFVIGDEQKKVNRKEEFTIDASF